MPKKKKIWFRLWVFRYRFYALVVIFVISPLVFYASDVNIPENVAVEGMGYEIVGNNFIASKIQRTPTKIITLAQNDQPKNNSDQTPPSQIEVGEEQITVYDKSGKILTQQLKQVGIDMGFISSQHIQELGGSILAKEVELTKEEQKAIPKTLDEVVSRPVDPVPESRRNILIYDKYKIRVPIIYTTFEDLFNQNPDGSFNFSSAKDTSPIESAVQRKLEKGIVHLAYTPAPGEVGNSYIIGHSSNYSSVVSPYNRVFQPIQEKSKPGEEFLIYDNYGRELKFRVFESLKISDRDVEEAYKSFGDRRVVTLQTSILGTRDGQIAATHRWLTRGELVVP
jgi:hypothetical protein